MSRQFWIFSAITVFAITMIGGTTRSMDSGAPIPRMEQSQPAVKLPIAQVAVTANGKTFHDPKCTAIHGKVTMMPASEAVAKGYTPCVRCMRQALEK